MIYDVKSVEEYLAALPANRKEPMEHLRTVVKANLPDGFSEQISYGMLGYVVPLAIYPKGYHTKKGEPLPFLSLASQKNYIALYHFGLYANKDIETWFIKEYQLQVPTKLDMGKSCIRFKNTSLIPYDLIAELCKKMTVQEYINIYEQSRKK
ncbi:DUF1801 domain-containing protein [Eubacteriaceae bacterium ES3]|nr:DUF1801 domain-containing protein [Eubacteriaceae bacterium ES3]